MGIMATLTVSRRHRLRKSRTCLSAFPAARLFSLCVLLALAGVTSSSNGDTGTVSIADLMTYIARLKKVNSKLRAEVAALQGQRGCEATETQAQPSERSSQSQTKVVEENKTLRRREELSVLRDTLTWAKKENLGPEALWSMPELESKVRACQKEVAGVSVPVGEEEYTHYQIPKRYREYVLKHNPKLRCKKLPSDPRLHPSAKLCPDASGEVDMLDFKNSVLRQLRPSCQAWCLFSENYPTVVAYHWNEGNSCYSAVDRSHSCLTIYKDDEKRVMDWLVADACEDLIHLLAAHTVPRIDEDILAIREKYKTEDAEHSAAPPSSKLRIRAKGELHNHRVVEMGNPYAAQ